MTRILPDKWFICLDYFRFFGKFPDLKNPQTFNEKLQWLKLYHRKPEFTQMVDKYAAKQYVAEKIGEQYVVPCYGVWDSFDEIPFAELPDQFVLKCTHDCGGIVICKDKSTLDIPRARKIINSSLKENYFWHAREWPYKNVKPRILAEQYLEDTHTGELRDYKFFCFNGEAKVLFVATDRQSENRETKFDFFDMEYTHLDIQNGHPNANTLVVKPRCFDQMQCLAGILSEGIPHVRVDFYEVAGHIYFGELTFFHWGGKMPFRPAAWDTVFGEWLHLPTEKTT